MHSGTIYVKEYYKSRSSLVHETMLLLTLDKERCNKCRTMKYKFVIEEDDTK
jgi:hypothetical protein